MPIDVGYDRKKNLVYVTVSGKVTLDEFGQALERITASDEFSPDTPSIWDMRNFEFGMLDREVMMEFIKVRECYPQRDHARVAVIVSSTLGYGMGRMYEMITAVRSNPQRVSTFRDLAEAEAWLAGDSDSA